MVLIWRGWGILVLFAPLVWMLAAVLALAASGYHEPDPLKGAATVYRLGAAGLALATITLWIVERYRSRVAPGVDQFLFVPVKYWIYLIALCTLAVFVLSFFPATP
jgi:hypothetical protein